MSMTICSTIISRCNLVLTAMMFRFRLLFLLICSILTKKWFVTHLLLRRNRHNLTRRSLKETHNIILIPLLIFIHWSWMMLYLNLINITTFPTLVKNLMLIFLSMREQVICNIKLIHLLIVNKNYMYMILMTLFLTDLLLLILIYKIINMSSLTMCKTSYLLIRHCSANT